MTVTLNDLLHYERRTDGNQSKADVMDDDCGDDMQEVAAIDIAVYDRIMEVEGRLEEMERRLAFLERKPKE
jgi:hypothetical protein